MTLIEFFLCAIWVTLLTLAGTIVWGLVFTLDLLQDIQGLLKRRERLWFAPADPLDFKAILFLSTLLLVVAGGIAWGVVSADSPVRSWLQESLS